jgi:ABC-type transport system involved in multi-copper enzyme maturation permease subunit
MLWATSYIILRRLQPGEYSSSVGIMVGITFCFFFSMANKYESVSEALDAAKSMPKSTRGRRRRQLYEEDVDQPLYCSPQLVSDVASWPTLLSRI